MCKLKFFPNLFHKHKINLISHKTNIKKVLEYFTSTNFVLYMFTTHSCEKCTFTNDKNLLETITN